MTQPPDDSGAPERGRRLMEEGAARLIDGVQRLGASWVVAVVELRLDEWGRAEPGVRAAAVTAAERAGAAAAQRVSSELRALCALDPAQQRETPLEVIRSLRREPTAVLTQAGVPAVERDAYEVRAFPDDVYELVPKSPNDLGDDELGGALLAWGLGKTEVLRARAKEA